MRIISQNALYELERGDVELAYLITLELPSVTLNLTDYYLSLTHDGTTYSGDHLVVEVPVISSTSNEPVINGDLRISNVGSGIAAALKQENAIYSKVKIRRVLVYPDLTLESLQVFSVSISGSAVIDDPTTSVANITLSNQMADFDGTGGRTTSNSSQVTYANDNGVVDTSFRHTLVLKRNIPWGRK